MLKDWNAESDATQVSTIQKFYRTHARVYEATRWPFLFGRNRILKALQLDPAAKQTLLEVGCGTGHNLSRLARHNPNLQLIGLDVSPDMLMVAKKKLNPYIERVQFLEQAYAPGAWTLPSQPDIVLFSYCLTMFNPGWEAALQKAWDDLKPGGVIAVVDFHGSTVGPFRRWMTDHHVRLDEHLLPALEARFSTRWSVVRSAYGGLWSYFMYVGVKG